MAITFFPRPKHRVFNYQPRYYDERKERLKELYAKYGKEYPGDEKATVQQAAQDLKDVAAPGEVREVIDATAEPVKHASGATYIPGQYIRSAYRKGTADRLSEEKRRSPIRTIIVCITIIAAILVAYYLSQGLVELFRG
ncbi:MAG: hypothetical protein J5693_02675 [Bacteroidales bacterium]|nr:hypothetical protein [Bacteroidales bacterium]